MTDEPPLCFLSLKTLAGCEMSFLISRRGGQQETTVVPGLQQQHPRQYNRGSLGHSRPV